MKRAPRILLLLAAVALLSGLFVRPTLAQDPKFDPIFEKAKQLETDEATKALDEYTKIKNEQKDRELQAEALLRMALLGYHKLLQLPQEVEKLSETARQEKEIATLTLARRAHEAIKILTMHYAGTAAERAAAEPRYSQGKPLKAALEAEIDHRNANSSLWYDRLSYKIVDQFVALTGRVPSFSYWFALLLIAVIVKLLTFPLTLKMYKSQREMQKLQPLMKELQEQYKDDRVKLNEKTMALFREHGVNPFASCLPMFVQLPFLFWVYHCIQLYEFHFNNGHFLWVGSALSQQYPQWLGTSLGQFDYPLLAIYAASNYITMRLTPATDPQAAQMQKTMATVTTFMLVFFFLQSKWSSAFIFYWLILNIISTAQSYYYVYRPNMQNAAAALPPPTSSKASSNGTASAEPDAASRAAKNGAESKANATPARPNAPRPANDPPRARPRRRKR